jgi:hypothetical protein
MQEEGIEPPLFEVVNEPAAEQTEAMEGQDRLKRCKGASLSAAVHRQPVIAGVVEVREGAPAGQSEAETLSGSYEVGSLHVCPDMVTDSVPRLTVAACCSGSSLIGITCQMPSSTPTSSRLAPTFGKRGSWQAGCREHCTILQGMALHGAWLLQF